MPGTASFDVSDEVLPPELRAEFEGKDNTSGPTSEAAPSVLSAAPSEAATDASTASATGAGETPINKKTVPSGTKSIRWQQPRHLTKWASATWASLP